MPETVYATTGKRKSAIARVRIKSGTGKIIVNGRNAPEYFCRPTSIRLIEQPFELTETAGQFDVFANIRGGGLSGQAGALQLGISRALSKIDEEIRKTLRSNGLLTRDSRKVERKKYGQKKARKRFQFSKR